MEEDTVEVKNGEFEKAQLGQRSERDL